MSKVCVKWALIGVMALGTLGCVAQKQYDDLKTTERKAEEQIVTLKAELEEAKERIRALQTATRPPDQDMEAQLGQLKAERDRLTQALSAAEERLRAAGMDVALPTELNKALTDLANSDPGLMTYDPKLGMIKFRSDLTFDSGSTDVKPDAKSGLEKLAAILKGESASHFEARIVGHTDNVPVSRPGTRVRHPDNWYLSVHRAIAVKDVLEHAGVPQVRLEVAGYGQNRPIVANGAHGAEANRRVEIFLLPSTYNGLGVESAAPEESHTPPAEHKPTTPERPEDYK